MNNHSSFLDRLSGLMEVHGLNKYTLSKEIKCNERAISRWFNNHYYPRYYILIKLANYFNCSINYILGLSEDDEMMPNKNTETFHKRLARCMKHKNFTAFVVSKICKIGQSAISRWINKNGMPEAEVLIRLAKCFECSVDFLLGISDEL